MHKQTGKQKILIVEDYADTRFLLKTWLERHGYLVLEAGDGGEAVEIAKREHPNLILMDFHLPTLDGFVATTYIRQKEELRDVPIIAMTAHSKQYSQDVAMAAGCNDYMEKPLNFDQLDTTINRWLK